MSDFKFIHTADLHLGSFPHFKSEVSIQIEKCLYNSIYNSFIRLVDNAISLKVDFIIISGDILDKEKISIKTNKFFISECNRLKEENIQVYIITGNHDAKLKECLMDIPENVYIFKSNETEAILFKKKDKICARIIGQSYEKQWENRRIYENYKVDNKDKVINIGVLHTSLDNNDNYVPCTLKEIKKNIEIDYWALGHIHKNCILHENPFIVYPGMIQGRDFKEEGEKGFYFVQYDNERFDINFIETSIVKYVTMNIDVSNIKINSINAFEDVIKNEGKKILQQIKNSNLEGVIVRWVIKGASNISNIIKEQSQEDLEYLIDDINYYLSSSIPFVLTEDIIDNTLPKECVDKIKNKNTVFNYAEKLINDYKEDDKLKEEIKEYFGKAWCKDIDNIKENELYLDDNTYEYVLEQCKKTILENIIKNIK